MTLAISGLPTHDEIVSYYDGVIEIALRDFVYANRRLESAVSLVSSCVTPATRDILDVGCGIGISTHRLHQRHPHVSIHGVDISPRSISVARTLFSAPGVRFTDHDMSTVPEGGPFDLVSLLDVYEHVPRVLWPRFNRVISDALSPSGVLVLTTPTPLTQDHAARHQPDALQVVDETMYWEDATRLAQDVGGTITVYRMVAIWHTNDYLHLVIERGPGRLPRYEPSSILRRLTRRLIQRSKVLPVALRRRTVRRKLGIHV